LKTFIDQTSENSRTLVIFFGLIFEINRALVSNHWFWKNVKGTMTSCHYRILQNVTLLDERYKK